MPLVINTNTAAITAQRHLNESRLEMEKAMERLSSGKRINSAMDDAAGLTISHSLDSKVTSLNQAARNANDGISLINLAEGALEEVTTMLIRMRELAVQAMNGSYAQQIDLTLSLEFESLANEITRISDNTFFNGISVIGASANVSFPVGHQSTDNITVVTKDMAAEAIGSGTPYCWRCNVLSLEYCLEWWFFTSMPQQRFAAGTLAVLDQAIAEDVDSYRATLGASANRIEHAAKTYIPGSKIRRRQNHALRMQIMLSNQLTWLERRFCSRQERRCYRKQMRLRRMCWNF
jgi:flagellin-like hook-associated protein FlgL